MASDDDEPTTGSGHDAPASYGAFDTLRAVIGFLVFFAVLSLGVVLMATAPWMRVSHDCSVFCVIATDIEEFF